MAYIPDQTINTGMFVPTTNVWDISQVQEIDVNSAEFKELMVRLYQNISNIATALNKKVTGYHINQEFVNGKLYFNPNSANPQDYRPGFIITINTGALGAGATAINHNLAVTNTWQWMAIYGAATNTGTLIGYPLPFAGAAGNNIEVSVTSTQILINNNSGITFTDSAVTLEYVKY